MSTPYRIADAAERSGFSATTLRYYEDVGLLRPVGRSAAGYRLYDDRSLERLRFIARAKQLGCTLDEIRDLATAWDGDECAPVQDQLRAVVQAKATEARDRIAALTTFATDVERAAQVLGAHRPEGPCDDTCGCTAAPSAGVEPGGGPPIACTLDAGDVARRIDDWAALLDGESDPRRGVTARRPIQDGLRLELGPDTDVAEVARLAAAESACCRFFSFTLAIESGGIALEVRAPADAADAVTALFGAAAQAERHRIAG